MRSLGIFAAACIASATIPMGAVAGVPGHPAALIVLPNAMDVEFGNDGPLASVSYRLKTRYPASQAISQLNTALVEKGWAAMSYDFLNPDVPSSLVRGWERFVDTTGEEPVLVLSWSTPWTNVETGEIVAFTLRYSSPKMAAEDLPKPDSEMYLEDLSVVGVYLDAQAASEFRPGASGGCESPSP